MIKKQFDKEGKKCKTTFTLPKEAVEGATEVLLLGEFNDWNLDKPIVMKKQKNGSFQVSVDLKAGKNYQFRYLIDRTFWENDWDADDYIFIEEFEIHNSVISISKPMKSAPKTDKTESSTKKVTPALKNATIKTLDAKSGDDLKK